MKRRFAGALLMCSLLISAVGCSGTGKDLIADNALYTGFALDGYPITVKRLAGLAGREGQQPDIVMFYLQWPSPADIDGAGFPSASVRAIRDTGALACITWEPMHIESGEEKTIPVSAVTNGAYDAYIRTFARQAADYGNPVVVRFAHEMNISRYHWGTLEKGYGSRSPGVYRELFRYVVDLCRDEGGTNILWVFCPNAESAPAPSEENATTWNTIHNYYPGGAYVDILGLDGYNWGFSRNKKEHGWTSRPQTFATIFEKPARQIRKLAPQKPLIIFETASAGNTSEKSDWLSEAFKASTILDIHGIIWFQADKETGWALPVDVFYGLRIRADIQGGNIYNWIKRLQK